MTSPTIYRRCDFRDTNIMINLMIIMIPLLLLLLLLLLIIIIIIIIVTIIIIMAIYKAPTLKSAEIAEQA